MALRYSLIACPNISELAVTHLDRVQGGWKICQGYDMKPKFQPPRVGIDRDVWETNRATLLDGLMSAEPFYGTEWNDIQPRELLDFIEASAARPVTIESYGPTNWDVKVRALAD